MPHIHTAPGQHDQTVSAYIIRYENGMPYLLLHRHKKYRRLMQPGGHIELDETPWQAVLHEIPEETGYDASQLRILQPASPPFTTAERTIIMPVPFLKNSHLIEDGTITDHYHDDDVYVFVAHDLPQASPGEGEAQELHWLTQEQIRTWDDADVASALKPIADAVFSDCLAAWQPVDIDTFKHHS